MFNMHILFLIYLIGSLLFTCNSSFAAWEKPNSSHLIKNVELNINSTVRVFDYYVPSPSSEPRPLIILLHGHTGNSDVMTGENHKKAPYKIWIEIAQRENLILAFPNGSIGPDGQRGWNDCRADSKTNPKTDDIAFLKQLISWLSQQQNIDSRRIYITGTSNGGFMSLRAAMEMSDVFAAAAPIVAAMPIQSECSLPSNKIPILFMNGTKDSFVPYQGGTILENKQERGTVHSIQDSVAWWVGYNQSHSNPKVYQFEDINSDDQSTVRKFVFNGKFPVILYEIKDGGHTEPSLKERYSAIWKMIVGVQNGDIEMAEEVWSFFKDQKR